MAKLVIKNLCVEVEGKEILHDVNLNINSGEFHVIMGPNGTGKSTLAQSIMGHYKYHVTSGSMSLDGLDLLQQSVDERSRNGLFLAMQYPSEIDGVSNSEFIKAALSARLKEDEHISLYRFIKDMDKASNELKMRDDLPHRYVNVGFSGGEKKRNEILQMKLLKPQIAILDEIDSGLDVDALRIVGNNVNNMKSKDFGALIITHYERLLDYLDIDFVHILINGTIVKSGGKELITKIDQEGYDWLIDELGIVNELPQLNVQSIGSCAVKKVIGENNE